jgi:hypothetical protein
MTFHDLKSHIEVRAPKSAVADLDKYIAERG